MWSLPDRARLVEVGLRDGLQAIETPLSTDRKVAIVADMIAAGFKEIEIASFAHPKVLPQLADAEAVLADIPRPPDVRFRALVPNARGARRAAACELDEVTFVVPAEDGMALKNQGTTTQGLLDQLEEVREVSHDAGQRLIVAVACAFFSPCYGPVSKAARDSVVRKATEVGADGVYLATTTGEETPLEVFSGIRETKNDFPGIEVGTHLHNRNGFAPANALAALSAGADWLESSVAGLGGDMWFPGDPTVLGNMATEDLVHLLDGMSVVTDIDLRRVRQISESLIEETNFPVSSFVSRGGTREELANATWD
ncbi:hydroxymethylglutaryl-CoA lyase [Brevibacterium marinum]|uniref:Hydroxymethylglutaryl-CoA lyase n=1 Tax=Brevibacterium marinum TaxID=418643 RepID=A0A846RVP5_9MICO|nr:hydroxymethylglutaryl-CoA lyase [Brevibacterium marinum]NJC54988.1 hydroxymethylglutaryl-CoA lyase [Brevibacterium marinum]